MFHPFTSFVTFVLKSLFFLWTKFRTLLYKSCPYCRLKIFSDAFWCLREGEKPHKLHILSFQNFWLFLKCSKIGKNWNIWRAHFQKQMNLFVWNPKVYSSVTFFYQPNISLINVTRNKKPHQKTKTKKHLILKRFYDPLHTLMYTEAVLSNLTLAYGNSFLIYQMESNEGKESVCEILMHEKRDRKIRSTSRLMWETHTQSLHVSILLLPFLLHKKWCKTQRIHLPPSSYQWLTGC